MKGGGLFDSLRQLLDTGLEIGQVRLRLLGTEVELEKRRLIDGLLIGAIAMMMLCIGITLLCGFIILLFWDGYRLPAVGVLALLFLAGAGLLIRVTRQRMRSGKNMFSASLGEIASDRSALQGTAKHHTE